jgi:hypothetical protein
MLNSDLEGTDEQPIFYGVGLLWLALHLEPRPSNGDLIELAEWIVRREEELHKTSTVAFDRWLTGIAHDPPPSPWESLGRRLRGFNLDDHRIELREWVKFIGEELAGGDPGSTGR